MGWAWCPGQARETERTLRSLPSPLQGAGVLPLARFWGPPGSPPPPTPSSCQRPLPRAAPRVLPDLLPTFPQLRSQKNMGQLPVRGQRVEVTLSLAFQK